MDLPKALGRLLNRRSWKPVVSRLYSHVLGKPLLIHPGIGQQLVAAFFRGAGLGGGDEYDDAENACVPSTSVQGASGAICLINISGPLTSRPEPGLSGSPCSYESIRADFDEAMNDGNVSAIVLRMDSPGGEAAQCFDLCDYIFSKRGKKPIVAQVDDMAYSGAYAIAAACDRIQVSRTSLIGSVGCVLCHMDQSGADKQAGLVFTYVFAGDHKVDGNPHEPLPDSVKNALQADVEAVNDLFITSVAKYRGLDAAAVRATQADSYMGEKGIAAKLADSVGTLPELLAQLAAPASPAAPESPTPTDEEQDEMEPNVTQPGAATETPEQKAARETREAHAAATAARDARIAALSNAVNASKLPDSVKVAVLAKGPRDGMTAEAQIGEASSIADMCVAAKLDPDDAKEFVAKGSSVEQARAEIAAAVAPPRGRREISTSLGRTSGSGVGTENVFDKSVKKLQAERANDSRYKSAKPGYGN